MDRNGLHSAVLTGAFIFAVLAAPQPARASEIDRLLDLLVKKNLVTQEEATALREQAAMEAAAEKTAKAAAAPASEPAKPPVAELSHSAVGNQSAPAERKEFPVAGASRIKLSGWGQARWTNGASLSNPVNTLEIRRMRLSLDGNLTGRTAYRVQMDAVRGPTLIDARLDHAFSPYAKVTVGQFKIPFSQENINSARDMPAIERSLVGLSLVPGRDTGNNGRDIGAQLYGRVELANGRPVLDYSIGVFNGAGINRRDDNRRKDGAGRLVVSPFAELSLGGSYYNGASGPTEVSRERAGVEIAYARKAYSLRGEYIWGHDGPVRKYGWYSQFAYRFQPKWEALARFDTFDPHRHAGQDTTKTYLVGVNWYLNSHVKLQANYGLSDEEARDDLTNLFLSQLQFQF